MKRILTGFLLIVLLAGCFAGCGSPSTENNGDSSTQSKSSSSKADSSSASSESLSSDMTSSQSGSSLDSSSSQASSQAASQTSLQASSQTSSQASVASVASTAAATPQGKNYTAAAKSLTGSVSFSGSTSVYPVIAALTERFKQMYPNVKIQITNVTGSGAGLADANAGKVSFGMRSSVYDGSGDDKGALNAFQIAMDGVAIVVHNSNSLTDVTFADIKNAFQANLGSITAPVSREAGSGTRTCFEDIMKANGGIPSYASGTQYVSSTEAVATAVSGNPNSIGYMSLGAVTSSVKKLTVGGVEATKANVLNGSYKFSRPFVLLRQKSRDLNSAEKEFLKFALSVDGQQIIADSNFIALSQETITAQLQKAGIN